jgi:thymidylate kinase
LVFAQAQRRLGSKKKKNKVLQAGGAVIAIVGPDATGKSTLVSETGRWLGENLAVKMLHAGKPPSSWVTAPINLLLLLTRPIRTKMPPSIKEDRSASGEENPARKSGGTTSLLYAIRAVTLAWDRRNLLRRGWRAAARGELVICDRYPSNNIGAMDSPRLVEQIGRSGWHSSIYNVAARLEQQLYAQIPPPDLVIRLHVSVDTAIKRNRLRDKQGEETDAYIEARHRYTRAWQRADTRRVFDVDTEQPLAETMLAIKDIIWRSI